MTRGYGFKPTDKELMQYLEGFVTGNPLNGTTYFIAVEDLYGWKELSEIFGTASGDPIRYYFTSLKRKCERGSRFLRGVGDSGTWKGQDAGQPIRDGTKTIMGFKKSLRYEVKKSRRQTVDADERGVVWLMKEYSLSDDYLRDKNVLYKDVVLCRIKRVFRLKTSSSINHESTHLNIHESDMTLDVYKWPEEDVTVSLPPSENSTLTEEVLIAVNHAHAGGSADDTVGGLLIQ